MKSMATLPTLAYASPAVHLLQGAVRTMRGRVKVAWAGPLAGVLVALLLLAACSTPVTVTRVEPQVAHRALTGNVLSTGELSGFTENVLRLHALEADGEDRAVVALKALHDSAALSDFPPDELFALAELSFQVAEQKRSPTHHRAAALYAYGYLFPDAPDLEPNPYDPRLRWAVDIYNRSVAAAFATEDGAEFEPKAGTFELPFGSMEVEFEAADLEWSGRRLAQFVPVADLQFRGLRNRYRDPGIGAPLAASIVGGELVETGFQVAPGLKVPVTAVLRAQDVRDGLRSGLVRTRLELHPASEGASIRIGDRDVPLEVEPSASLAYGLSDPGIWKTGLRGFLIGTFLQSRPSRLVAFQPYEPGRIPVVFIHGTASVSARWADMVNDLLSDKRIRNTFQFWFFAYETGNPMPYSALLLRDALAETLQRIDPEGRDPALRQMVLVGHSQGGLLAKLLVVDSGTRLWDPISPKPLDSLALSEETRELLRRALFVKPADYVRRVIFISTPQRGSYVAGWSIAHLVAQLVRLPVNLVGAAAEFTTLRSDELRLNPKGLRFGSVYGMTPGSPLITGLSAIPVAPSIPAHSIIAIEGDGPIETGDDGVVKYQSAHIEEAVSEFIVRSGHSSQANPHTIAEVGRILLLHASETCAKGGIACPQDPESVLLSGW